MSDSIPQSAGAPALPATQSTAVVADAHGFDPQAYDWYPVLRRPRADGWTHARQRLFIEVLADTGSPKQAAQAAGMTRDSAYKLRRAPGGEGFAAAWDAAIQQASKRLVDIAFERAVDGVEEVVWDPDGRVIGHRTRYNDRLLMFLLRAHQPDRYRHASRDARAAGEAPPPSLPPVAEAVSRLDPVPPGDPAALLDEIDLRCRLDNADLCAGELPRWHHPNPPEPEPCAWEEEQRRAIDAALEKALREADPDRERKEAEHRAWLDDQAEQEAREIAEERERRARASRRRALRRMP